MKQRSLAEQYWDSALFPISMIALAVVALVFSSWCRVQQKVYEETRIRAIIQEEVRAILKEKP